MLEQQGLLASRLEKLGEEHAILLGQSSISRIYELREAYRAVGHDLVKLLKFVDLNATGIRKILKKFDKRFGYKFTNYYVSTRSNHPYSQLQGIFKHVVRFHFIDRCILIFHKSLYFLKHNYNSEFLASLLRKF